MSDARIVARYPAYEQKADGLRAAVGLVMSVGPFLVTTPHPVIAVLAGASGLLFLVLALRTLLRQFQTIHVDEVGLRVVGLLEQRIDWDDLEKVSLKYYATKHHWSGGWLQLVLAGAGHRVALENQLDGFNAIAACVAEAILEHELVVDKTTRENFLSLGHYLPGDD
ncbi:MULTISPECIES: hypothetical protein [unclassified Azospirillum]|uniref:hypothetical protein n=1 Tax=unclassified Azospirillum TaxID=2630922 RepID=UPI000B6826C1|nr:MULTISPECIES: hypothetical protein [unclassified Azospirillum]SNS61721.1 hypothetical protein SAMN05880556_10874 [Azospirillum sp. RU38E]SNS80966.1 hypothetical protein SAMN05880591_10874 [Azospirillum sp. RU37A]